MENLIYKKSSKLKMSAERVSGIAEDSSREKLMRRESGYCGKRYKSVKIVCPLVWMVLRKIVVVQQK